MGKVSSIQKPTCRKKPEFVIAVFSMHYYPRSKNGSFSGFYRLSKPIIRIHRIESLRIDDSVKFGNDVVRVVDWSGDRIVLQFEKEHCSPDEEKLENRTMRLNMPISTGPGPDIYDRISENYFGCWTSWKRFLHFYLGVKWNQWVDDRRDQMIKLPLYFSASAIRRRWKFRWNQINGIVDKVFHLHRPVKWK